MTSLAAVRSPGILRTLSLAAAARLPLSTIGALILLQARHLGLSYALATGAFTVGLAVASPLLGRLVDRRGQAPVLHLTGLLAGLAITAVALVPSSLAGLLIPLAAVVGLSQPPVSACVRAILTRLPHGRDRDFVFVVDVRPTSSCSCSGRWRCCRSLWLLDHRSRSRSPVLRSPSRPRRSLSGRKRVRREA